MVLLICSNLKQLKQLILILSEYLYTMKYSLSYQQPSTHYLNISLELDTKQAETIQFQLPAWRPGRYELGNFAKNIQKWEAQNESGKELEYKKLTKDLWEVNCKGSKKVIVKYNYFANDLNAGSTFLSEEQLYVNPVNCLLYVEGRIDEECELQLSIPNNYACAIPLPELGKNVFKAKNFDELADSPFIASPTLKHHEFKVEHTIFHLWFQGEFKPKWKQLEDDFVAYTKEQINLFGGFPTAEYHYLFQILPHSAYHGVEHSASTVIALGPSYNILKKEGRYEDLLGVSSHELFHTWNVKRIRPIEMVPYDFSKENYTRLGYLTEGATTWYGDLMLYRSKVFGDEEYFKTFNQLLDRHYNNPGANNLSVADSSFDTWLDGYTMGVPNRKSSIYTEGALITFMLDVEIRRNTNNKSSFDDVLRKFYTDFYKKGKGISEKDYKEVVEEIAQKELSSFFDNYVNGTADISSQLDESLNYLGLEKISKPSGKYEEAYLGIKQSTSQIIMVFPSSPAEKAGISIHDKVVSINGFQLKDDLSEWLEYFKGDQIKLELFDAYGVRKEVNIKLDEQSYFSVNRVSKLEKPTKQQIENRTAWMKTN